MNTTGIICAPVCGIAAGGDQFVEARGVMLLEGVHPLAQAIERQTVRRQDERVGGQFRIARQRVEKAAQRIAVGRRGLHADQSADARQDHVAGDQYTQLRAIKRCMLGRVPVPRYDPPFAAVHVQALVIDERHDRRRQLGHPAPEKIFAVRRLRIGSGQTVLLEERFLRFAPVQLARLVPGARSGKFRFGHVYRRAPMLGQPRGQAAMIGMKVRDNDPGDGLPAQLFGEYLLPQRAGFVRAKTAIDDGPAVAVREQP